MRCVDRERVAPIPARLAELLPADHLARLIWAATGRLDLTAFYASMRPVRASRALATSTICASNIWLCGGVSMNNHTLSDFRTQHLPVLDALLTQVLGCLDYAGLIAYAHTAQDGIRVRASAGAASFRREATLDKCLATAQSQVATLTASTAAPVGVATPRLRAARPRSS